MHPLLKCLGKLILCEPNCRIIYCNSNNWHLTIYVLIVGYYTNAYFTSPLSLVTCLVIIIAARWYPLTGVWAPGSWPVGHGLSTR